MTKKELKEQCETLGWNYKRVLAKVRREIVHHRTNWAVTDVRVRHGEKPETEYTYYGYRKNTTGEYVSNSYRRNFGWKNTFYQAASLVIRLRLNDYS